MGHDPRRCSGFATVTVLGLVAVTVLLCAGALHDALFGEQLATSRLLHQRAAAAADIGVAEAMGRLASLGSPGNLDFSVQSDFLQPGPPTTDTASVTLRYVGSTALPRGFSAGRFHLHRFEIESTGHAARGINLTQLQGALRTLPAAVPATGATP
jgi:type II secretory pathway component PulK